MISKTFSLSKRSGALVAAALFVVAGCATSPPSPPAQLALANAAVNNAQSAGAGQYAALELRAAQEKLTWANEANARRDMVDALRLAEAAEVDARLAEAKARNVKAQHTAGALQASLKTLQQELERKAPGTGVTR